MMEVPIAATARCEIQSVIHFLSVKKVLPVEIHRKLCEVHDERCRSVQHIRKWCKEFTTGRMDIHNEDRSRRPSLSDEIIEKVKRLLHEDQRVTIFELALRVPEISASSIERILTKKLTYHKVCMRWVPRMLSENHKQQRL
ncbi:hypothetical protein J437_LFUL011113 [Ladona fulva]|uniref:Mos1 transposase HTH domain-containing protein n=1 Tax=Ladona fulva TaxID=123851 RepID=A0A8K0P549_LADFU|nr:hypothetical protein J437_LFUL011113 [Ladona fulva]